MKLNTEQTSSSAKRRARTRSLIQIGGLLEHAGTLDIFNIPLGVDLQSDASVKNNIAALFKGLLLLNEMVISKELDLNVLALQGLEAFKTKGLSETRPLDRKKYKKFEAYPENNVSNELASELANDNQNQNKLLKSLHNKQEEKM